MTRTASSMLSPILIYPPDLSNSSTMPNTPSTDEMDTNSEVLITRRSSSGGLLSPEVDMGNVPRSSIDVEQDGFYLLKKDSQRRLTLSRVLEQDGEKICDKWMLSVKQDFGTTVLRPQHLELLLSALKDYIMDQNRRVIEEAMTTLKEDLDFDSNAINELHSAIYLFQEAVNAVLRMHSIKPHWMFALDNLVRNAVQAAITVLSPELGANLAGQEGRSRGAGPAEHAVVVGSSGDANTTPSALSTVNSTREHTMMQLRQENHKLHQELLESYQQYQSLLRLMLEEQKTQTQIIREVLEKKPQSSPPLTSFSMETPESLNELLAWCNARGVPTAAAQALTFEEYTLDDLLNHMQREDLSKLGLKGGVELRIWRSILEHRLHGSSPVRNTRLRRLSSTDTNTEPTMVLVECQRCKAMTTPPTLVIRDQEPRLNGDDNAVECYAENGIVNL
ncbi:hypothetical protein EVAR_18710_1 [Eumeta japonica]|uniref:MAP3K HisK-N-like globin domain-containing protein n=1 Tax=Eumeta variegata TaxID=151549 RepID=A0A4C1UN60_EUMVA|nr:hypothetical protein EVAR_18710_1 [Eumeta japonica]